MKKLLGIREDVSKIPTEKHIETSHNFVIYIYLYFRKHLFFQKKRFYFKKKQHLCIKNKKT